MSFSQWIRETLNGFSLPITAAVKCKYQEKLIWKHDLIHPLFKTSRCEMCKSALWLMMSLQYRNLLSGKKVILFYFFR